ncbi:MAG: metal-dependent transcriptional regulator [Flavobacteriales bacterium]|nr:metal-dependent transcriptional regulator [Flavobacteriales bacterium]MBK6752001.1 metal-dependent transcriptional regulator [Flavobacteriales bacterium]MBK7270619.1 metal-dependent transcriptional regulator [Flavobacteriales bacterium]MBK9075707.1 metal-dependent transcriptional regulator [Flavobacteriales bacterium]
MVTLTRSEEDHLKAVYALLQDGESAFTKDIAARLNTKASSVTDMLKKLAEKGFLKHEPYYGAKLTAKGTAHALTLVRKHRLWETFLVERLSFGWDEVHEVAEQLEHISSPKLVDRLDDYLGNPRFDPHGDPIPDRQGKLRVRKTKRLDTCTTGDTVRIAAVSETTDGLLRLLDSKGLRIGSVLTVQELHAFDGSMDVKPKSGAAFSLSKDVSHHLQVESN